MMYRVIFYFFLLCSSLFVNANPTYFAHERFEKFGILFQVAVELKEETGAHIEFINLSGYG